MSISRALITVGLIIMVGTLRLYAANSIRVDITGPREVASLSELTLTVNISNLADERLVTHTIVRDPPVSVFAEGEDGTQYIVRGSEYLTKAGKSESANGGTKNKEFVLAAKEQKEYSKPLPDLLGRGEHLTEPKPGTMINIYVLFIDVAYIDGQYKPSPTKSNIMQVKIGPA